MNWISHPLWWLTERKFGRLASIWSATLVCLVHMQLHLGIVTKWIVRREAQIYIQSCVLLLNLSRILIYHSVVVLLNALLLGPWILSSLKWSHKLFPLDWRQLTFLVCFCTGSSINWVLDEFTHCYVCLLLWNPDLLFFFETISLRLIVFCRFNRLIRTWVKRPLFFHKSNWTSALLRRVYCID